MNGSSQDLCIESQIDRLFYPLWEHSCKIGLMAQDYKEVSSDDQRTWELTDNRRVIRLWLLIAGFNVGILMLLVWVLFGGSSR